MSAGKSLSPIVQRWSGTVKQSRHIQSKGTGQILSETPSERPSRHVGFALPPNPQELGESLWTARDLL